MLRNNSSVSACSLSSCRLKAEALARALNSRIWPCTWVGGEASGGDGMSAPDEEDDLYFDASPSPIEDEESIVRYPNSSAATVAGRAKLYELLQQHVADDATEVFYDVSEDGTLTDQKHAVEMGHADGHTQGSNCQKCQSGDMDVNDSDICNHDSGKDLVSSEELYHPESYRVDKSPGNNATEGNLSDGKSISETPMVSSEQLYHPENSLVDEYLGDSATEENLLNGKSMTDISLVSSEQLCHSGDYCVGKSDNDKASENDVSDGNSMSDISETNINFNFNEQLENCGLDSGSLNHEDSCSLNTIKMKTKQSNQIRFSDNDREENFSNELLSSINDISSLTFKNFKSAETGENNENEYPLLDETEYNDRTEKRTTFPKTVFPKNIKCKDLEDTTNVEVDEDELHVLEYSGGRESIEETIECDKSSPKLKTMVSIEITEDSSTSSLTESEGKSDSPKSSLHVFIEDRPMISRSTSLKTGKTPPGTPSRKKIVRFADVLGLDLEDVRHIMPSDLPNIPSSAYIDLVLSDDDKPTPTNEVVVLPSTQSGDSVFKSAAGFNSLYPMFSVPGLMSDFKDRVHAQGICLESVTVSDLSIQCTCRVMNWGYKKRVVARYSVNDWASSNDIDASYVAGSTQDDTDAFSFNIFLSPFHKNVKFALRYQVNGKEYWDNNKGENYCLGYYSDVRSSPSTSPTWAHQFW